jgi:N-acetyl-gamma-glutamyl-phosphate reductase
MTMAAELLRIAVVGATGYTGAELVRLLAFHPYAHVTTVTSQRMAGERLREQCPWLATDLVLQAFDPDSLDADVVFLCQESGFALQHAPMLAERMLVVDLSADFRLKDHGIFRATYGLDAFTPKVPTAYGLPELGLREEIRGARLIANPGCHVTAASIALKPFVNAGVLTGTPVIDSKTGVSGAGRSKADPAYTFSELDGDISAYKLAGHRHVPEIEQNLGVTVRFTPHLMPIARGLHATIYVPASPVNASFVLHEAYKDEPFVRVHHEPPHAKAVQGSNRCDLYATFDAHSGHLVITSVIDNLVKGASGAAIQNMNLAMGIPEAAGLPLHGLWP